MQVVALPQEGSLISPACEAMLMITPPRRFAAIICLTTAFSVKSKPFAFTAKTRS